MDIVTINKTVEDKVLDIRGQVVIIDSDVAMLYGVETKRINEAVKNNPDKFPLGYLIDCQRRLLKRVYICWRLY